MRSPAPMLSDAIAGFVAFHRSLNHAESTVTRNESVLRDLRIHVTTGCAAGEDGGPDINVRSLTTAHLTSFRQARLTVKDVRGNVRPRSGNAINAEGSTLRTFFQWMIDARMYTGANPTIHIKSKRAIKHDFERIAASEWPRFLNAAPNPRDRFLLALDLYTLCRSSEIRTIKVGDLKRLQDGHRGISITRWKVSDTDTLPVALELEDEIKRYLKWYTKILWAQGIMLEDHHMAIPCFGREVNVNDPITGRFTKVQQVDPGRCPVRLGELIKPILRSCGYKTDKEGMHTMRRSAACAWYYQLEALKEAGELPSDQVPIQIVSDMCGHKSLDQTWDYIGLGARKSARNKAIAGKYLFRTPGAAEAAVRPPMEASGPRLTAVRDIG